MIMAWLSFGCNQFMINMIWVTTGGIPVLRILGLRQRWQLSRVGQKLGKPHEPKAGFLGPAFFQKVRSEATAHFFVQCGVQRYMLTLPVRVRRQVVFEVSAIHGNLSFRPGEIPPKVLSQPLSGFGRVGVEFLQIRLGMLKSHPDFLAFQNPGALL